MLKERQEVITLIRKLSYEKREVTLASGRKSDFYVDMKQTLLNPFGIDAIAEMISSELREWDGEIAGVGGMTMGADPITTAVSLKSLSWRSPLMAFYIRKEPKTHGTSEWVEGLKNFTQGDSVFVLEDVVTSGGSSLKAVERARLGGLVVKGVVTCIDRQEGGRETIEGAGLLFKSLFTKSDIVGS